ncbi:MAG: dicarboxylate/amino acid:cation symporter [Candidatus Brocadiaceae bacterium]|nr:dicarboxylate/amino acid:cation symporter [Candidatus Brocadiaceae bacterium]
MEKTKNSSIQRKPSTPYNATKNNQKQSRTLVGIIIAIILGTVLGGWLPGFAVKFSILGEMFLNVLMMLVIPLIMLSMITGITRLGDIRNLGSLGWHTLLYYVATTGIAVFIGMVVVTVIQPGKGISPGEKQSEYRYELTGKNNKTVILPDKTWEKRHYNNSYTVALLDQGAQGVIESFSENTVTVRNWIKPHQKDQFIFTAEDGTRMPFRKINGKLVSVEPALIQFGTGVEIALSAHEKLSERSKNGIWGTLKEVLVGNKEMGKEGMLSGNLFASIVKMEILPVVFFSLFIGAALSVLGERAHPTIEIISTLNDAVMQLVHWIMIIAPVGIFGLIAARIGNAGGFRGFLPELLTLGKYGSTVIAGLFIHGVIVLPLILKVLGKRNPAHYVRGMGTALLNAFSTASSSATLPLTLQGVEEQNNISNRTASFVLPLGATINMDGTALYEAVAAMFIAQVYGIPMTPFMQAVIFLTSTLAAIGAAGIPEAGLVTMVIVLKTAGLPIEGIGLILVIDWILDRFRTTVNVWGDSVGAGVIETLESRRSRG